MAMEITLDKIHTYLECPLKYEFEHVKDIESDKTKNHLFKEAVHKTISFFFFTAMSGYIPSLAQMKDKWANTWEEASNPRSVLDEILSTRLSMGKKAKGHRDPHADKYRMLGFEMIYNFYNFNKDNPGNIIGVDLPYRVALDDVIITGKFELIREIIDVSDGKRYIEIVDFKTNADNIDPFLVKHDFNLSLASYAFRELFQSKEDRVKYHYLKTGRDIIIQKQDSDYERMKAIIHGVKQGIQNELYYPRQSFMCKSCPMKEMCDRVRF